MRLVTRSDFDGIVCGSLLYYLGIIDNWIFAHPKDIQDGKVEVTKDDVLANVPLVESCGLWFDHHISEDLRLKKLNYEGVLKDSPSAARIIWEYYGGHEQFPERFDSLLEGVDKVDSANLTEEEILDPKGWILIGLMVDPRTGLGRFKQFRLSNLSLMEQMIMYCSAFPAEVIVTLPDMKERLQVYQEQSDLHKQMLDDTVELRGLCAVIDLRQQDPIFAGNRFLVYGKFPQVKVSVHVFAGSDNKIIFSVGKSVTNRGSRANIGAIMLKHGGGGHFNVGTCQVPQDSDWQATLEEIIQAINKAK